MSMLPEVIEFNWNSNKVHLTGQRATRGVTRRGANTFAVNLNSTASFGRSEPAAQWEAFNLKNANSVILQLSGPKVGVEVSAAVGGVKVQFKMIVESDAMRSFSI